MAFEIFADRLETPSFRQRGKIHSWDRVRLSFDPQTKKIKSIERVSQKKLASVPARRRAKLILPGFVDPHTHLVFAGDRAKEWKWRLSGMSYQEIAKKGGGIRTTMKASRKASEAELLKSAQQRLKHFLAQGVTTLEIKSGYGLDFSSELKILRVIQKLKSASPVQIFSTFMGAHALPPEFANVDQYIEYLCHSVLPEVSELADFQDVFVEKGYFSARQALKILKVGKGYGLQPRVHAHEFGRTGGVKVACQVKALSADHLQYLSAQDIRALKKAKVVPVILPGTSFFLGAKRFAPARALWDAGLPVAIASDFNPGTNPGMALIYGGTLAAIHQKLTLEEVFTAQTWHAAQALGRRDRGLLRPGMRADFILCDCLGFENLYYHYGLNQVERVFIGGKEASIRI